MGGHKQKIYINKYSMGPKFVLENRWYYSKSRLCTDCGLFCSSNHMHWIMNCTWNSIKVRSHHTCTNSCKWNFVVLLQKPGFIFSRSRKYIDDFKKRHTNIKTEQSGPTNCRNLLFTPLSKEAASKQKEMVGVIHTYKIKKQCLCAFVKRSKVAQACGIWMM